MSNIVDFENVSLAGLESSPVSKTLAGLRANESRYYKNKYNHDFTVSPAAKSKDTLDYVNKILQNERDIKILSKALETSNFIVENIKIAYVFYESGLSINVMYSINDPKKRAVGFKLSEGMDVPKELEVKFKFPKQKSKLAGIIRGSFFVIKGEY
ncbi:MAG: phage tail protein [Bacteroidales bacterium]|nr:phage tail protein [Bacteroidales bacterium]